jgi:hypothetical protein
MAMFYVYAYVYAYAYESCKYALPHQQVEHQTVEKRKYRIVWC